VSPKTSLESSDTHALVIQYFKLRAVGNRYIGQVEPMLCNSLPQSLRAGTLASANAAPGTVTALLRSYLLATAFGGHSSNQPALLHSSVAGMTTQKRAAFGAVSML